MDGKSTKSSKSAKSNQSEDPKIKQQVTNQIRIWDKAYMKWVKKKGPKPGPHPDPNHKWNTNPEQYKGQEAEND